MKEYPMQLERYFFTHQEVTANPDFSQGAESDLPGIEFVVDGEAIRMPDDGRRYGITAHVGIDSDNCANPPYFFNITAFGIVSISDDSLELPEIKNLLETFGIQLLFGAIRERLADMTARGPWNSVSIDFIPAPITLDI